VLTAEDGAVQVILPHALDFVLASAGQWAISYKIEVDDNVNFSSPEFQDDTLGPNDHSVMADPLPKVHSTGGCEVNVWTKHGVAGASPIALS
jgi:hypothetical protein